MNANSGDINQFADLEDAIANQKEYERLLAGDHTTSSRPTTKQTLIPIPDEHLEKLQGMSASARKNWMRNKACPCESGKKFKRCCWDKFTH